MRFIMQPRRQAHLLERRDAAGGVFTREGWLRDIFTKSIAFRHRGIEFYYVPTPDLTRPEIIVGRVGRQVIAVENQPPDAGFSETQHEAWRAGIVLIDPRHH